MTEFPSVIDATQIATKRSCLRKMQLAYLEHWKLKGESIHLHAGKAFSAGLEAARLAFWVGGKPREEAIGQGVLALTQAYGDYDPPEDSPKSLNRMQGALVYYFDTWPLGADGKPPHLFESGKHGIEFSFAIPLPYRHPVSGDPIIYAGRSDMICDFAGGLYIEDDKTTSRLGATWAKQWDLRSQFTGYCWAARESRMAVNGVLVRGVSILKTKYDHAEAITYRPDWQIERWLKQILKDLADLESAWRSGYWDFALDHACDEYGGCAFKQICSSEQPEAWLPMYFERRKWNPLDRTETLLEEQPMPARSKEQHEIIASHRGDDDL